MEKDLYHAEDENAEFRLFLHSLDLRITKSDWNGKKCILIGNTVIYEGDEFYELVSEFAKEESEKEDR
jgi:hypothetical protein